MCHYVGKESVHKCSGVKTKFKSRYMPIDVVSGNEMKIEMSHEIKSTKQPATHLVNHTNQLPKNIAQPAETFTS